MNLIDRTGHAYGRLTVLHRDPSKSGTVWVCRCTCGVVTSVRAAHLARGSTKSCGCLQAEQASSRAKRLSMGGYKGYRKYNTVFDVLANTSPNGNCLEWAGPTFPNGYAKVGKTATFDTPLLHRWVFKEVNGFYPPVVMHSCDNRKCINPAHLLAGTTQANVDDKVSKGRQLRGSRHPNAKLTEDCVARAFVLRAQGFSQARIASEVGTTRENIRSILHGKTWA